MFTIDVRHNIDEVLERVAAKRKSIPVATSNALNLTAFKLRELEIGEMRRVFDRPTTYTLNSLFVKRADVGKLSASVFLKENTPGRHYLRPQIFGGARLPKPFESALRARGYLPPGMFAVPGSAAALDAYGNMSRGQIIKILSALGAAERVSGFSANRTSRSIKRRRKQLGEYFVGRPGGGRLPLGVWQVFRFHGASAVKPILIFVRQPQYSQRFNFYAIADTASDKLFRNFFERELQGEPTGRSLSLSI